MTGFIIKLKLLKKKFFSIFTPKKRGKNGENHCFFNCSHILKIHQKSSLNPILIINSSIDSTYDGIYHKIKIIEKKFFSNFYPEKRGKNGENHCFFNCTNILKIRQKSSLNPSAQNWIYFLRLTHGKVFKSHFESKFDL